MKRVLLITAYLGCVFFALNLIRRVDLNYIDVDRVEKGKINSNINTVSSDSIGFIWLGTEGGLYRYDGYEQYLHDDEDRFSIDNDIIAHINEDDNRNLWDRLELKYPVQHDFSGDNLNPYGSYKNEGRKRGISKSF